MVSAVTQWRWPEAECYHANVAFEMTVKLFTGEIAKTVPAHCVDCGHVLEGDEWSGR